MALYPLLTDAEAATEGDTNTETTEITKTQKFRKWISKNWLQLLFSLVLSILVRSIWYVVQNN